MTTAPTLRPSVPPESASRHFDPVLRPDLVPLYANRADRLRHLAQGHDLAVYLQLAAAIAEAQGAVLELAQDGAPLVDPAATAASDGWLSGLDLMLERLAPVAPVEAAPHLESLAQMPAADRKTAAVALAEGRFDAVSPALAPVLWAALSVAVAKAARRADLPSYRDEEPAHCPVCGSAPVASLIHTGDRQGLRYLHCAMCECEWHMVRAKCSNCGDAGDLDYLSFDTPEAPVRAEACGACGGYLKVISAERDPTQEVVADDLATLLLDEAAQSEGYHRSGFNPFALPG